MQLRGFWNVYQTNTRMTYAMQKNLGFPLVLFTTGDRDAPSIDGLQRDWATCGPVSLERVSGSHMTMMTAPHVVGLAQKLTAYLKP